MSILKRDIFQLLSNVYQQLDGNHSLDSLSKHIGWSKYHLHRGFRRIMGETPKQHILRLRLERAAVMLTSTQDSVLSIALFNGFQSHEVFVRAFRRNYGCSPIQYRSEALAKASADEQKNHQNIVCSVGPCVHLYHSSYTEIQEEERMPTLSITRQDVAAQPILYIQRSVVRTKLQPLFAECFPKLFQHCMASGIAIAGQPVARYVSTGTGLWTIDCAIPIAETASAEGEMQAGFLEAGPVALAVHAGAYDELAETYAAIEVWVEEQGFQSHGAPWEAYVTSPTEVPDVAGWRTEVYWPLIK